MGIINTTPHPINFRGSDGIETVIPSDPNNIITATAIESDAGTKHGVKLVSTRFEANKQATEVLNRLEAENPDSIIVGSIVAAQAFPGRVFAMTPAPGFERVAPAEKRMNPAKFTTF